MRLRQNGALEFTAWSEYSVRSHTEKVSELMFKNTLKLFKYLTHSIKNNKAVIKFILSISFSILSGETVTTGTKCDISFG